MSANISPTIKLVRGIGSISLPRVPKAMVPRPKMQVLPLPTCGMLRLGIPKAFGFRTTGQIDSLKVKRTKGSIKILIVGIGRKVSTDTKKSLEKKGYEVARASSQVNVIKKLRVRRVDLILVEIGKEDEQGIKLLELIWKESPRSRVILVTEEGSKILAELASLPARDFRRPNSICLRLRGLAELLAAVGRNVV